MNIGENVKAKRKAAGLSQPELAKLVNVSTSMICQIERGSKTLTLPLAVELADILSCDVKDFAQ